MARPKKPEGEVKDQRVPIVMSPSELQELDDWMHENRVRSRGDAIRRLVRVGIFAGTELEQLVDVGQEVVSGLRDRLDAAMADSRILVNENTAGAVFEIGHVEAILGAQIERLVDGLEAAEALYSMLVAVHNGVIPYFDAETVKHGDAQSSAEITAANLAIMQAEGRRREREENRYLSISLMNSTPEERKAYESLSEDEKEAFLDATVARLEAEEKDDPSAFALKYNLTPFWKRGGWLTRLKSRK